MRFIFTLVSSIFTGSAKSSVKKKVKGIYFFIVLFNIAAWLWALIAFDGHPVLLGTAVLAYTFGLRHAFDADHIAAIDCVTRKMMQQRQQPVWVGFFFSIGHSMILAFATIAIFVTVGSLNGSFESLRNVTGVVGTLVSASFLFIMAALNATIARATYRTFKHVRNGGAYSDEDFDMLLNKRGFLSRIFRPLFGLINRSWHMLFIGFLFGLGFDTITEIGLLSIAAAEAAKGLSLWAVLAFPAVFAAGMSFMDTTDGVLMLGAYGWAYNKPIRKLYYNLTITSISVLVALVIGGIEVVAMLAQDYGLTGSVWSEFNLLNGHFGILGLAIVGIFVMSWIASMLFYRFKGYDRIIVRSVTR